MDFEYYNFEQQQMLKTTLDKLGVAYEFDVYQISENIDVNAQLFRNAIAYFFKEFDDSVEQALNKLPYPKWLESYQGGTDVESAIRQPLDSMAITDLDYYALLNDRRYLETNTWFENFYSQFILPPYGLSKLYKKEPDNQQHYEQVWQEFCEFIGLCQDDKALIQVNDWIGYGLPEAQQRKRADWSAYFLDGLDWWGIWCLTIYNPTKGTLAVVTASATD